VTQVSTEQLVKTRPHFLAWSRKMMNANAILYLDLSTHEWAVADLNGKSKGNFCRERGIELEMATVYITREDAEAAKAKEESAPSGFLVGARKGTPVR
jgi:hypothetical protein